MPLNEIQQLCTGEPEFVVGEIYGLRQWFSLAYWFTPDIYQSGLVGHNNMSWTPGAVHTAVCDRTTETLLEHLTLACSFGFDPHRQSEALADDLYRHLELFFDKYPDVSEVAVHTSVISLRPPIASRDGYKTDKELRYRLHLAMSSLRHTNPWGPILVSLRGRRQMPKHSLTDPRCTCGFYAYTDAAALHSNSSRYAAVPSVFGIIKGYGLVTQGTRGFRAEKAEIVSLTRPLNYREGEEEEITSWRGSGTKLHVRSAGWEPDPLLTVRYPDLTRHTTLESLLDSYRGPDERPVL